MITNGGARPISWWADLAKVVDKVEFSVVAQVNTPAAVKYIEHGGILNYVLRRLLA